MDQTLINELAIVIGKINYVYKGVRKTKKANYDVEIELLRQYSVELYDGLVKIKNSGQVEGITTPTLEESVSQKAVEQEVQKQEEERSVFDTVADVVSDVKETSQGLFEKAKEVVSDVVETVEEKFEETVDFVKETTEDLTEDIPVDVTEEDLLHTEVHPDLQNNLVETVKENTSTTSVLEVMEDTKEEESTTSTQVLEDLTTEDTVLAPLSTESIEKTILVKEQEETVALDREVVKTASAEIKKAEPVAVVEEVTAGKDAFQISPEKRATFTKELFNNDAKLYNKSITDLSESTGYIEALTYINLNLRYDLNWDDDSPTVKDFLQTVKSRFLGNY